MQKIIRAAILTLSVCPNFIFAELAFRLVDENQSRLSSYGISAREIKLAATASQIVEQDELHFELADGVSVTAKIHKKRADKTFEFWNGKIVDDPDGSAVFVVDARNPEMLSGEIHTGGKSYSVVVDGVGVQYVLETQGIETPDVVRLNPGDVSTMAQIATKSSQDFIDVMMVYTDDALAQNAGIEALIEARIESVNQALEDSCVNFRYRLVHTEPVTYTETGTMLTDLGCIYAGSDACLDNLHTLRDTHGADLVQMVIWNNDARGIAYSAGVNSYYDNKAYSVVALLCDAKTMAHEFGHNIGLQHDRYTEDKDAREVSATYGDAWGFVDVVNKKRDIMAYANKCNDIGVSCNRVAKFSSPNLFHSGIPFGDVGYSDNARYLNDNFGYIANYRTANTSYDPKITNSCGASAEAPDVHCFIATAAVGSYMHKDVQFLRRFRDLKLKGNALGKMLVDFYYKVSPPLAYVVEKNVVIKKIVRVGIKAAVFTLQNLALLATLIGVILILAIIGRHGRGVALTVLFCTIFFFQHKAHAGIALPPLFYDEFGNSAATRSKLPVSSFVALSAGSSTETSSASNQKIETTGMITELSLGFHFESFYFDVIPYSASQFETTDKVSGNSAEKFTELSSGMELQAGYKWSETSDLGLKYQTITNSEDDTVTLKEDVLGLSAATDLLGVKIGAGVNYVTQTGEVLATTQRFDLFLGFGMMTEAVEGQHLFEYNILRSPKVVASDDNGFTAQGEVLTHSIVYGYLGDLYISDKTQLTYQMISKSAAEPIVTGDENITIIRLDLQQNLFEGMQLREWIVSKSSDASLKTATTEFGVGFSFLY